MTRSVAAIFAHPDDEVLACGASLARHAAQGDEVRILILATGLAARGQVDGDAFAELRREGEEAARILGAASIDFVDFPDNAMDSVPLLQVVQRVEAFLLDFPASRIYTHHAGDVNVDHRVTHQALITACRPLPGATTREILACEVNSSTEWAPPGSLCPFLPTEFSDIGGFLEKKLAAMAAYARELREWPHPRSLRGIATQAAWRGMQSGCDAAEAFVTVRRQW